MSISSWIRRQFANGVITTAQLNGSLASGVTSTFAVGSGQGTTFPNGSVGSFIVTVDQGTATEEKILCSSRSSDTFTIASGGRGYNGTTAQNHNAGAFVLHTIDAQDLDEANQVANQTLGAISASGDLLIGASANTLSRLARGSSNNFLQTVGSTLQWTAFGSGQSQTLGTANADGVQTTPARSDHTHAGLGQPIALTGAIAATRFAGGTSSGAPTSGTFSAGDFVVDQAGRFWVCTSGGTPGTWVTPAYGIPVGAVVATAESTSSTSYVDLTTTGPAVTVTTGTSALVTVTCNLGDATAGSQSFMGYGISGATTIAADNTRALVTSYPVSVQASASFLQTGLTPGSNVFTGKYQVNTGTGTFANRGIIVTPLP